MHYTESKANSSFTSQWANSLSISEKLINELNPQRPSRTDLIDLKPMIQRYTDYYHGNVKDELSKKVELTNESIQKMKVYIDTIAPKVNEYMLKIVKDWYSAKMQCSGLEARITKEVEITKKGLQGMITALNKELDVLNADKMEQMIEVESTKAKFKDLQIKEQELKTVQIKLGDMMQLMDKRVKQIIELEDALNESNEMITEKDERIEKLQQEVGITSIVIFYDSSSLNSAYISSSFFFCYSLTTLGTRWRDSDRRVEGFVKCCD